jgi:hypothetical protein
VHEALRVGVADRFSDLTKQVETGVDVEAARPLCQIVVEALGAGSVLEDESRTERMLGVRLGLEDPLVLDTSQDLVLTPRCPP